MTKRLLILIISSALAMPLAAWADQPSVQVEPPQLQGSRPIEEQTKKVVIRDYLESWNSLRTAMAQNRPDLLDQDFVGTAKDKLTDTIQDQMKLGLRTRYQDRSHDLQIVFYSLDGLSIQMIDTVSYDEQVLDHDKVLTNQHLRVRYIVVMTPAARWQVRIFQAEPQP